MHVKILEKDILWKPFTIFRPSIEYFNNIKLSMVDKNLRVNFIDYKNVIIVVPNLEIKYIWINHNNKDYFYFLGDIIKITNKGYVIQLVLDIWGTFGITFIDYLYKNNKSVFSIRSHNYNEKSLQYTDPLLNSVPLTKNMEVFRDTPRTLYKTSAEDNDLFYRITDTNYYIQANEYSVGIGNTYLIVNQNPCNSEDNNVYIIPVGTFYDSQNHKTLYNNLFVITQTIPNNIIGYFIGPPVNETSGYGVFDKYLMALYNNFKCNRIELSSFVLDNEKYNSYAIWNKNITKLLNFKINNTKILSQIVELVKSNDTQKAVLKCFVLSLSGFSYNLYSYWDNKIDITIDLGSYLPVAISQYSQYVQATKSSADTSYRVYKQQAELNGALSVIGGVVDIGVGATMLGTSLSKAPAQLTGEIEHTLALPFSGFINEGANSIGQGISRYIGGSTAYANPYSTNITGMKRGGLKVNNGLGAALGGASIGGGISKIASGLYQAIQGPKNMEKSMRAHYADKERVLGASINSIDTETALIFGMLQTRYAYTSGYTYTLVDLETIKYLNNLLYIYGEYNPRNISFRDIYMNNRDIFFIMINKLSLIDYINIDIVPYDIAEELLLMLETGICILQNDNFEKMREINNNLYVWEIEDANDIYFNNMNKENIIIDMDIYNEKLRLYYTVGNDDYKHVLGISKITAKEIFDNYDTIEIKFNGGFSFRNINYFNTKIIFNTNMFELCNYKKIFFTNFTMDNRVIRDLSGAPYSGYIYINLQRLSVILLKNDSSINVDNPHII